MNDKTEKALQRVAAIKERAQYAPDLRETVCELVDTVKDLVEVVQKLIEAAAPAAPAKRTSKTSK